MVRQEMVTPVEAVTRAVKWPSVLIAAARFTASFDEYTASYVTLTPKVKLLVFTTKVDPDTPAAELMVTRSVPITPIRAE